MLDKSTATLELCGVMDADYFIYWDDVALSWALRNTGAHIYACMESKVWHHQSAANRTPFYRYYFLRNKIHLFAKYSKDADFAKFSDALLMRLFRMYAADRHEPSYVQAYSYALNDAFNNIRGMAGPHRVVPVAQTRPVPAGAKLVRVPHVLDVERYERDKVYIDPYQNVLFGEDDCRFAENLDTHFEVFRAMFDGYIKSHLGALREVLQ